jgi:hypothetical protein
MICSDTYKPNFKIHLTLHDSNAGCAKEQYHMKHNCVNCSLKKVNFLCTDT